MMMMMAYTILGKHYTVLNMDTILNMQLELYEFNIMNIIKVRNYLDPSVELDNNRRIF